MGRLQTQLEGGYWGRIRKFRPNAKLYLACIALGQISLGAYSVTYNLYLRALGYSTSTIGLLVFVETLASGLVSLPAGWFSDNFGRKRSLYYAIIISGLAAFGQISFTNILPLLVFFNFLRGAANTFKTISQAPFLTENSDPEERVHLFSANQALSTMASVLGSSMGGALPAMLLSQGFVDGLEANALRWTLAISIGFYFLAAIPVFFIQETRSEHSYRPGWTDLGVVLRSERVRYFAVFQGLIGLGAGMVIPFFNVFLREQLGATTDQVGSIMAISSIVLTIGVLLSPILAERWGKVRAVTITQMLSIPFLLTAGYVPNLQIVAVAFWLRMALMNMSSPISGTFAMEMLPASQRATANSIYNMSSQILRAIAGAIGGYLMDNFGLSSPYILTAGIYFVATIYYKKRFSPIEQELDKRTRAAIRSA
ncbi:MAG: MFS transporter [Firmicutes bacterium]|nr:MFS transporter [Bacillota bacterium]